MVDSNSTQKRTMSKMLWTQTPEKPVALKATVVITSSSHWIEKSARKWLQPVGWRGRARSLTPTSLKELSKNSPKNFQFACQIRRCWQVTAFKSFYWNRFWVCAMILAKRIWWRVFGEESSSGTLHRRLFNGDSSMETLQQRSSSGETLEKRSSSEDG